MFEAYDMKYHQKRKSYAVKGDGEFLQFLIFINNKWAWVLACDFVPIEG